MQLRSHYTIAWQNVCCDTFSSQVVTQYKLYKASLLLVSQSNAGMHTTVNAPKLGALESDTTRLCQDALQQQVNKLSEHSWMHDDKHRNVSAICHTPTLPELGGHNLDEPYIKLVWLAAFFYNVSVCEVCLQQYKPHHRTSCAFTIQSCWHQLWVGNFDVCDRWGRAQTGLQSN